MVSPLNINLIIPFKSNKQLGLNLYLREIQSFRDDLENRVEDLKAELLVMFGENFELNITARSDGHGKKYFWRFKSSKRDRRYSRLHAESIVEYIRSFDSTCKNRLLELEQELVYINANLKLLKGIVDAIEQSQSETRELREAMGQLS